MPKQAALLALVVLAWQTTIYAMVQRTALAAGTAAFARCMSELLTTVTVGLLAAIARVSFGPAIVAHGLAVYAPTGCCCAGCMC